MDQISARSLRAMRVDVSQNCIDFCKQRFESQPHARFFQNDGKDLSAADHKYNLVFSFGSLVGIYCRIHRSDSQVAGA